MLGVNKAVSRAEVQDNNGQGQGRLLAAAGIVGAIIASSCCVVPLVLVTLGISGAWIGSLTELEPYKPYFLTVTAILLGAGFWHVYFKPKRVCAEGSYCARPRSSLITQIALWLASVMAILAATINFWAPFFY